MSKFRLNIHHRDARIVQDEAGNYQIKTSPLGHFYISLQKENNIIFFGKYPKQGNWLNNLFGPGEINTESERILHEILVKEDNEINTKHVYTRTINLSESEYNKALNFAKASSDGSISDNFYLVGANDCRHFVQSVWVAMGRSLPFTVIYSTDEMIALNTAAASDLLRKFGSRDIIENNALIIEEMRKENIARKFNLPLENIHDIDSLNNPPALIACYEGLQITKFFKIIVSQEVVDRALIGVSDSEFVTTTVAPDTNHNDTQVSPEMQELIRSFKLPNIHGGFSIGYKGINTHYMPLDYSFMADTTAMNTTVLYMLNIHHSRVNEEDGAFYISLVSPQNTTFYTNIAQEFNDKTKDTNTKSIALRYRQYSTAEEWVTGHSNMTKFNKDGREFIQELWNALEKPLYFTVLYSKDELLSLGTTGAEELLNLYGSYETVKHGQFVDKALSKELLANRLNIHLDRITDGSVGYNNTALVKSYVIQADERIEKIVDRARAMVINSFNTPQQCRIQTKYNNTIVPSPEALKALQTSHVTIAYDLVGGILQQYQWAFSDNVIESIICRNNQQELKNEYMRNQPNLFYAQHDLVENIFNDGVFENKTFNDYIMSGYGEPQNVHLWYVNKILYCRSMGNSILGFNINDEKYDNITLANNFIQLWNEKLELLTTKSELNVSTIPFYEFDTYNLVGATIRKTLSPLGIGGSFSSGYVDELSVPYYELECDNMINTDDVMRHNIRHDKNQRMYNGAGLPKPIGYDALVWAKKQISKIQKMTLSYVRSVSGWYKSRDHDVLNEIVTEENCKSGSKLSSSPDEIYYNLDATASNHVSLLSNEHGQNFEHYNKQNSFNMIGELMLANLVVRMLNPDNTKATVIRHNNIVDSENAQRLAYGSYSFIE